MINGGWQNMAWTSNLAAMQVDGMLDLNDGNAVIIDALTGSGTVTTIGSSGVISSRVPHHPAYGSVQGGSN